MHTYTWLHLVSLRLYLFAIFDTCLPHCRLGWAAQSTSAPPRPWVYPGAQNHRSLYPLHSYHPHSKMPRYIHILTRFFFGTCLGPHALSSSLITGLLVISVCSGNALDAVPLWRSIMVYFGSDVPVSYRTLAILVASYEPTRVIAILCHEASVSFSHLHGGK